VLAVLSSAARSALASFIASSSAQKCMKLILGCSVSMWLWIAVTSAPLERSVRTTVVDLRADEYEIADDGGRRASGHRPRYRPARPGHRRPKRGQWRRLSIQSAAPRSITGAGMMVGMPATGSATAINFQPTGGGKAVAIPALRRDAMRPSDVPARHLSTYQNHSNEAEAAEPWFIAARPEFTPQILACNGSNALKSLAR
jgi:hypothetical protein